MAKEVFMCRPCAEELKAAGRCIMHSPVKDKGELKTIRTCVHRYKGLCTRVRMYG